MAAPGGSTSLIVTVGSTAGFAGIVSLSVSGLPAGVSGTLSPSSVLATQASILSLNAATNTASGDFLLTVTGTSGTLNHSIAAAVSIGSSMPIKYTYDPIGRLTTVSNQAGQTVRYSYDQVGNLLSISPPASSQISVTAFSPSSGLPGTTVQIVGAGFNTNPSQDTVQFNGMSAVVVSATATALSVRVPSLATSGPITVTAFGNSTSTLSSFTVLPLSWTNGGINSSGSTTVSNGVYTLQNQSGTIGGTSDGLEFAYEPMVGDGTVVARMTSYTPYYPYNAPSLSDGGIMLRTGPTPTAAMVYIGMENGVVSMKSRSDTGQTIQVWPPSGTSSPNIGTPYWFELVRVGNTITASVSANGVDWNPIGSPQTLNILSGSTMYAGPVVAGANCCSQVTATFDNVTVSTAPDFNLTAFPLTWTSTSAGATQSYAVGIGALNGFSGSVSVSVTGLPNGTNSVINPPSITGSGTSSLTIAVETATPAGSYPFTVSATSGSTIHTVSATLSVTQGVSSTLPQGWTNSAIGTTSNSNATYANSVFTVQNASGSIQGTWDNVEFLYEPMVGDGTVTARLSGFSPYNGSSDAGVMLRTGPTPTAAMMYEGIENGAVMVKWRTGTGQTLQSWTGPAVATPYWFQLVRTTNGATGVVSLSAYSSPNGVNWVQMGSTQALTDATQPTLLYAGLTVAGANCCTTVTGTFDNVSVVGSNGSGNANFTLSGPTGTQTVDVGESVNVPVTVSITGQFTGAIALSVNPATLPAGATASFSPATLNGAGVSTLILTAGATSAPGSYTLTVVGTSGSLSNNTSIQLTINAAANPPALVGVSPSTGSGTGGTFTFSATDPNGAGGNISWLEGLINGSLSGTQACYVHYDQTTQTIYLRDDVNPQWVGSAPVPMGSTRLSNSQCTLNSATTTVSGAELSLAISVSFTQSFAGTQQIWELAGEGGLNSGWADVGSWTVTLPSGALPSGWTNNGINASGTSSYTSGVFTLQNQSGSIGGAADAVDFVNESLVGDGAVIARLTSRSSGGSYDAGVMLRTGPTATAAMVYVGMENGYVSMKSRSDTGQTVQVWPPSGTATPSIGTPYWFELARVGNTITASVSPDGVTWYPVGSPQTLNIPSGSTMYGGLVVANATGSFDNVNIVKTAPGFSITAPGSLQTVYEGSNLAVPVSLTFVGGFAGSVTLGVQGSTLPAGATATFSPTTLSGSGTSTLTIATGPSATGTFTITVTATSGSTNATASFPLLIGVGGTSAFSYYRTITINHAQVGTVGADPVNFPILFSGVYPYLATTANGGSVQSANGYDIVFSSDINGLNLLNWEMESYNPTTGAVIAWIQVPALSHTTDTVIYMFYGNTTVSTFQGGATGSAWNSNFAVVYHLGSGTALSLTDSTTNSRTGTNNGSVQPGAGEINGAAVFNGSNSRFISTPYTMPTTNYTYEMWINSSATGVTNRPFGAADYTGGTYGTGILWGFPGSNQIDIVSRQGGNTGAGDLTCTISAGLSGWHHLLVTMNSASGVVAYFDNAQCGSNSTYKSITTGGQHVDIGRDPNQNNAAFSGTVDEVRISTTVLPLNWIISDYNSQNSPSTFYTIGSQSQP